MMSGPVQQAVARRCHCWHDCDRLGVGNVGYTVASRERLRSEDSLLHSSRQSTTSDLLAIVVTAGKPEATQQALRSGNF